MKRVIAPLIIAIALAMLTAGSAFADTLPPGLPCVPVANGNGAASCTVNAHAVVMPFFPGPCIPADFANANVLGNAVFHVTQNGAGDFWLTTTNEGTFIGLAPGFSGHATQWFGDESNNMNQVQHAISDGQITMPGGATLHFHETFHFSISASGQQSPIFFDNCTAG